MMAAESGIRVEATLHNGKEFRVRTPASELQMIKLIPLTTSTPDWATFLKVAQEGTGYNPLRGVDSLGRELSDPAKFIAALSAFQDRSELERPIAAIRESRSVQRHLFYQFLLIADADTVREALERTDINITSAPSTNGLEIALMSGTLQQWRDATLECCTQTAPYNLRFAFDGVVIHFERLGLQDLWHDWRKRALPDQTFLIEHKK